ncbi:hypothetical protein [uncultured Cohaesibacter sp.]|uniref:hypothetical protein n=1 Tax=uncultured Cohaesibacter sp. TaxID=1002546 RepID=UPI002AA5ECE7|nr:hypothetical protein [uncultured Cohaesibacter sp.]
MKPLYKSILVAFSLLALVSCANGTREFELYADAFDLQNVTAQQVLDKVASAERAHWARLNDKATGTPRFSADNAAYYVNVGDPPLTASMRKSLRAVKKYNDALIGLANGDSAAKLTTQLSSIVINLGEAQSSLLAPSVQGSQQLLNVAKSFSPEVGAAHGVLKLALTAATRDAFRTNLVRAYPEMKKILLAFRDGTDDLYFAVISVPGGVSRDEKLKDRELFASWVLLIDSTTHAMEVAVSAAMQRSPQTDLDALAEYSIEMRVLAEKIRAERNR